MTRTLSAELRCDLTACIALELFWMSRVRVYLVTERCSGWFSETEKQWWLVAGDLDFLGENWTRVIKSDSLAEAVAMHEVEAMLVEEAS